ncbi:MAG: ribonuclease III [Thermoanaerobaculia bacterium]
MLRALRRIFRSDPIDALQRDLGYHFKDPSLLEKSLTHRSFANERDLDENYERLEFLGDTVVGLITAEWLYRQHPDLAEGDLSKLKGYVVSEPVLAGCAERLGLGEILRLGVGEERSGGRCKRSLLADALEAVLGAVFLDGGLAAARKVFLPILETASGAPESDLHDAKTELQELVQGEGWALPEYRHISEEGPDHQKRFHVECWVAGRQAGAGEGGTKKEAEQRAARAAVDALGMPDSS